MDNATLLRKLLRLADHLEKARESNHFGFYISAGKSIKEAQQEVDGIIEPLRQTEQTTHIYSGGYPWPGTPV